MTGDFIGADRAAEIGLYNHVVPDEELADRGLALARQLANGPTMGLAMTNARPVVPPTFGAEPMLGTNPIAFAAPSDMEYPFSFDAATSIVPRGKIEVLARAEKPAPEGWVVDTEGKSLTDAGEILRRLKDGTAALLPLGGAGETLAGYKGYDLATIV